MRPTSSSWLQLDADPLPLRTGVGPEWGQLLVVWSIFFITAGVYQLPATLLGARCNSSAAPCSIAQEFDVSDTQVAWLPATFLLCKGLLALPAGVALQRWRPKRCIVTGVVLLCMATFAYSLASSYAWLVLCYVGFGIAYCLAGLTPSVHSRPLGLVSLRLVPLDPHSTQTHLLDDRSVVFVNSWFDASRKATSIGDAPPPSP